MANSESWKNDINGNWGTAADWIGGLVPGAATSVTLGAFSNPYTVISSQANYAQDLDLYSSATLDITAGVFTLSRYFANSGTVKVEAGATLSLGVAGQFVGYHNGGKIQLNGSNMVVKWGTMVLNAGGVVEMSNSANNHITGGTSAQSSTLANVNQTIEGAGYLFGTYFDLTNGHYGVIDANQTIRLVIASGAEVLNDGLIELTNLGGLLISGALNDEGVLKSSAGLLRVTGNVDGFGIFEIAGKGQIELGGYGAPDTHFDPGSTGTLILDHGSTNFLDNIYGALSGTHFDLRDVVDNATTRPTLQLSNFNLEQTLTVTDGAHTVGLYLELAIGQAAYSLNSFRLGADGHGGTLVTVV